MDYKYYSEPKARSKSKIRLYILALLLIAAIVALILWHKPIRVDIKPSIETREFNLPAKPKPKIDPREKRRRHRQQSDNKSYQIHVQQGDNLSSILNKYNIDNKTIQKIIKLGNITAPLLSLMPHDKLSIVVNANDELVELLYPLKPSKNLIVQRKDNGFSATIKKESLEPHIHYISTTIYHSLYAAAKRVKLSDKIIDQLATALSWSLDFTKDIQSGDRFTILYEDYYKSDKKVKSGDIIAASFTNRGNTYNFVRYTDPLGHSGFFTPNGHSLRRAFLRLPVRYTRISSRFTRHRKHPILHRLRAHKGVDYAAPRGTPIKATGDGKVIFRGWKGGYGRTIILKHGHYYSTLYAHMSRFTKKLHIGSHVHQGQTIGYVGASGLATGPHLHYEFRINGKHFNPITVKLPAANPIPKKFREDFLVKAKYLLAQLSLYKNAQLTATSLTSNGLE